MTGQDISQIRADSLRSAQLETHLETTRERLNLAASQLVEMAKVLLTPHPSNSSPIPRPWLNELIVNQVMADLRDAESELAKARDIAAEPQAPEPENRT